MESTIACLERLTRETHKAEAEVMTLAFQVGLRQLWREHVLGKLLRGEVGRSEAIELVGIDWVELAERQHGGRVVKRPPAQDSPKTPR